MATYYNISGELTRELLEVGDNVNMSSITLTNTHVKSTCTADLYVEKKLDGKYYLMKGVNLPLGATLSHDFTVDNTSGQYGLFLKLTAADVFTLTGTIDPAASTTVTGVGTAFLTEISIGDEIIVSGETRTVSSIASDTSLIVSVAFSNNSNDTSPDCDPIALVDVIIS
jgi:hypothetical protein